MIAFFAAVAFAVPAPMPSCPAPPPAFSTIAVDPATVVEIPSAQQFAIALRATEDGGYHWRLQTAAPNATVARAEGSASVWDTAFTNVGRPAGTPPMVGGQATEFFLFSARVPGTAKLTFGLFGPGQTTATRTTTYTVRVTPSAMTC